MGNGAEPLPEDHRLAVADEHAARWRAVDPLVRPPSSDPAVAPDLRVHVEGTDALGRVHVDEVGADEEGALWGALRTWRLRAELAGPQRQPAFAALLAAFDQLLEDREAPTDDDTTAVVTVPSRDVELVRPLTRLGYVPTTVVAARRRGEVWRREAEPRQGAGVASPEVRPATTEDLSQLERLAPDLNRYDANFGTVSVRPAAAAHLSRDLSDTLAGAEPWLWVAVTADGEVVGFCRVMPPEEAGWIAAATTQPADEVAYLGMLYVRPEHRACGAGARLVAAAHERLDGAGVGLTLLHHALPNPHSTPFWARQGYRPLWTAWHRRPARRPSSGDPGR